MELWCEFKDKVVFVIGVFFGIGREICFDLVKVGCKIIVVVCCVDCFEFFCFEINSLSLIGIKLVVLFELDVLLDVVII